MKAVEAMREMGIKKTTFYKLKKLYPMEECKRFCQEEAGRRFKKKYWNPITIKIAIA